MEMKIFIGLCAISTILLTFPDSGKCDSDQNKGNLTPRQIEILQDYNKIGNLSYGEKCDWSMESEGYNNVRIDMKPVMAQVLTSATQHGSAGNADFQLTSNQKNERDSVFNKIEEFTSYVKIVNNKIKGICNGSKSLHCDRKFGECLCGESEDVRRSLLVPEDGSCKFDFDSGCIQSEFSKYTDWVCRKGSTCVTGIENLECTLENTIREHEKNPALILHMQIALGYVCYCEKGWNTKNIHENYSASQFSYSGSVSLHFDSFGIRLMSTALVLFFGQRQYI